MKKQFATYKISSAIRELGFDEECIAWYNSSSEDSLSMCDVFGLLVDKCSEDFIKNSDGKYVTAPTWSQVIGWFNEKYDFDIIVIKDKDKNITYYWYYITAPEDNCYSDITNWQDRFGDILDECSQDIEGHHLNHEKFNKLIFERKFAFNTRNEAREQAILAAIEIIKEKKSDEQIY